jgi:GT2 family glycosyltransferase
MGEALMNHALAILTYVPADGDPGLRLRLPFALESLAATGYPGRVFVVDDGSTDGAHRGFLSSVGDSRITVIRRPSRGGVSRAKNTCLRILSEQGVDVGFVAEDDIEFRPGWWERYLDAHAKTGISHFSWAWDADPTGPMRKTRRRIGAGTIVQTSRVNGVLLTFTRDVLERVGGFRILPRPWGHTHTNWTRRIIAAGLAPYFADVVDSNEVVRIGPHGVRSAIAEAEKEAWAIDNEAPARELAPLLEPFSE